MVLRAPRNVPLFDYRCEKGHVQEVLLRGDERGPAVCDTCGGKLTRLMGAPASPKVRGGKRRRDIKFRKKGDKINLSREGKNK